MKLGGFEITNDLIADRYNGLSVGPRLLYSFESQEVVPVDGTHKILREFSPFTLSLVPPQIISDYAESLDVNVIARANSGIADRDNAAREYRQGFGSGSVSGNGNLSLSRLEQIVSAGQIITSNSVVERERSVIVDQYTAADIALQVEQMLNFPPLTLLVNPSSFSVDYAPIQEYGDRTRKGYIFQRWGEEQPSISFSGTTAAYITGKLNPFDVSKNFSGVGWQARRGSAAFQNFLALYTFYRNNGMIHDTIRGSMGHHMVGAIAINYDQWTYIGHIESFDYSYTQEMQTRLEWSLSFKADIMFDNSGDPSYLGMPRSFGTRVIPTTFQGNGNAVDTLATNAEQEQRFNEQLANTPLDFFVPEGR